MVDRMCAKKAGRTYKQLWAMLWHMLKAGRDHRIKFSLIHRRCDTVPALAQLKREEDCHRKTSTDKGVQHVCVLRLRRIFFLQVQQLDLAIYLDHVNSRLRHLMPWLTHIRFAREWLLTMVVAWNHRSVCTLHFFICFFSCELHAPVPWRISFACVLTFPTCGWRGRRRDVLPLALAQNTPPSCWAVHA